MADSYVGRYGDTLRRLTAMDAESGAFAQPQRVGGADTPGIAPIQMGQGNSTRQMLGEVPAPPPQQQAAGGGMDPSQMMGMMDMFGGGQSGNSGMMSGGAGFTDGASAGGGMMYAARGTPQLQPGLTMVGEEGPEVASTDGFGNTAIIPNDQIPQNMGGRMIDESGAMGGAGQKPTSWKDLSARMPKAQQNKLVKQIEERTGTPIKEAYTKAAAQAGDEPKAKNKREMALYIAEITLRTISNMGTGRYRGNSAAAFSDAMLDTEARRGAISRADQAAEAKAAETRRLEGREDAETLRKEGRTDAETRRLEGRSDDKDKSKRTNDVDDREDKQRHEEKLERLREALVKARETDANAKLITDSNNELKLVDGKGNAIAVTEEVSTPQGSRGQGTTQKKTRKPVKVNPKPNASGVDQDTVVRKIADEAKRLAGDRTFMRGLKNQGLAGPAMEAAVQDQARKNVMQAVDSAGGTSNAPTAVPPGSVAPANPFDAFDKK